MDRKLQRAPNGDTHSFPPDDSTSHTLTRTCRCVPQLLTAKHNTASGDSPEPITVVHYGYDEGKA